MDPRKMHVTAAPPKPEPPLSIIVPVIPWGMLPISISVKGVRVQTEAGLESIIQVNFVFPDGHIRGVPLSEENAVWLRDQIANHLLETKGLIVPKLNGQVQ